MKIFSVLVTLVIYVASSELICLNEEGIGSHLFKFIGSLESLSIKVLTFLYNKALMARLLISKVGVLTDGLLEFYKAFSTERELFFKYSRLSFDRIHPVVLYNMIK